MVGWRLVVDMVVWKFQAQLYWDLAFGFRNKSVSKLAPEEEQNSLREQFVLNLDPRLSSEVTHSGALPAVSVVFNPAAAAEPHFKNKVIRNTSTMLHAEPRI